MNLTNIFTDAPSLINPLYLFYDVPIKSSNSNSIFKKYLTINWVDWEGDTITEEEMQYSFEAHNKKTTSTAAQTKLKNTIDFYKYSMQKKQQFFSGSFSE